LQSHYLNFECRQYISLIMNKFISEKDVEEKKKKRQEEWEKVRNADDPETAPEEEYDPRSLFERLQENKDKKQAEFEEKIKFKNQFRGIDEDESNFLSSVSQRTAEIEREKREAERKELDDLKKSMALQQSADQQELNTRKSSTTSNSSKTLPPKKSKLSQSSILKSAIKRKSTDTSPNNETAKRKVPAVSATTTNIQQVIFPPASKCTGVLPGIGSYGSDNSDESENEILSDDDDDFSYQPQLHHIFTTYESGCQ